jgi:hypothetical protein
VGIIFLKVKKHPFDEKHGKIAFYFKKLSNDIFSLSKK